MTGKACIVCIALVQQTIEHCDKYHLDCMFPLQELKQSFAALNLKIFVHSHIFGNKRVISEPQHFHFFKRLGLRG